MLAIEELLACKDKVFWIAVNWEYKVIHVNVNANDKATIAPQSDPNVDSNKLGVSPEFIQKEFPNHYKDQEAPKHPAQQLEEFLTTLGQERWELVEFGQVGDLLMFIFKRPTIKGEFDKNVSLSFNLDLRLKSFLRDGSVHYYNPTNDIPGFNPKAFIK